MAKKKPITSPNEMSGTEPDHYRALIKESTFGHLDDYFSMMMRMGGIEGEEKDVYELAVRAFINDISYNGLPSIRRERYNQEFKAGCLASGLLGKYEEMMRIKREHYP